MYSANKTFTNLLQGLSERQREVLIGRFGLEKSGKAMTLAALGARYKVTRERIRQIESAALSALRVKINADPACADILERSRAYLKAAGGAVRAETMQEFLRGLIEGITPNHLAVLIESTKTFYYHPADKHFHDFYYLDKLSLKTAATFLDQWAAYLRQRKEQILTGHYAEFLDEFLKKKGVKKEHAQNYLAITKRIHENPFGDVGLAEWPEILPRTIRDRVYLVLKRKHEPMHFRVIAKTINEAGFGKSKASPPTVHNELIKDDRFVLVGRGIYALTEHGYEPGTAREVISRILQKQGPLKPKAVIQAVQKERFFKPNTVMVNLQNKMHFERLNDGTYRVRQA